MVDINRAARELADKFSREDLEESRDIAVSLKEDLERDLDRLNEAYSRESAEVARQSRELDALEAMRSPFDAAIGAYAAPTGSLKAPGGPVGAFAAPPGSLGIPSGRIGTFAAPAGSLSPFGAGFASPGIPSRNPNQAMRGLDPGLPSAKPAGFARLDSVYGTPTRSASIAPSMRAGAPAVQSYSRAATPSQRIAAILSAPSISPFGDAYDNPFGGARASQSYAAAGPGRGTAGPAASDPFGDGGWANDAFGF